MDRCKEVLAGYSLQDLPNLSGRRFPPGVVHTAVAALPAVGSLLVTSLFVVPAAIARQLTGSVPALVAASVAVAAVQGLVGLYDAARSEGARAALRVAGLPVGRLTAAWKARLRALAVEG